MSISAVASWLQAGGFAGMGASQISQLALPLLFFVAIYFLLVAPNQKKQKQWQTMLAAIKAGDRVTTNGGLRGIVLQVKDDCFVVRVAPDSLKLEIVKSAIAAVVTDEAKS